MASKRAANSRFDDESENDGMHKARVPHFNALKSTRRIEIGLIVQDMLNSDLKLVCRATTGGGTRSVSVNKNMSTSELQSLAVTLFFPSGQ